MKNQESCITRKHNNFYIDQRENFAMKMAASFKLMNYHFEVPTFQHENHEVRMGFDMNQE